MTSAQPGERYDFGALATRAVDQLIIDRESVAPVHVGALADIAFAGVRVTDSQMRKFKLALTADPRCEVSDANEYTFRPELSPGSDVAPSMLAVITGKVEVTPEEFEAVRGILNDLAETLVRYYEPAPYGPAGILTMHGIRKVFRSVDLSLSRRQTSAFFEYIKTDPRFRFLPDGRFVLLEVFQGNVDDIEPLKEIEYLPGLVNIAIYELSGSAFDGNMVMDRIVHWGYRLDRQIRDRVRDILASDRGLAHTSDGMYVRRRADATDSDDGVTSRKLAQAGMNSPGARGGRRPTKGLDRLGD